MTDENIIMTPEAVTVGMEIKSCIKGADGSLKESPWDWMTVASIQSTNKFVTFRAADKTMLQIAKNQPIMRRAPIAVGSATR